MLALAAAMLCAAGCAHAPASQASTIGVERAIIRASEGQSGIDVAGYALFRNRGADDAVIAAECTCAAAVELHVIRTEGAQRRMTTDWPLALPAGAQVEIAPGSAHHFMLIGIPAAIASGDVHKLHFQLRSGRTITADFTGVSDSAQGWRDADAAN